MPARFPIFDLQGPGSVRLSLEQRYETLESIFIHQFFQLYRLLGQRFGWEAANEIALAVPESSVPLIVEGYRRKFGLEGEGAELLSQVMQAEFQAEGSDVAVVEEDPEAATFDVLCSFGGMLQSGRYADVKIEHGLCHEGCAGWMNRVGATMEPAVGAERLTWMGDGAPRCRFALRRRAGSDPPHAGHEEKSST
jgi:hypothetical protein